jgi:tRNA uracil 4-sulfurtransferase
MEAVIIHYAELALKGGNRDYFESTLFKAVKNALNKDDFSSVKKFYGRFMVNLKKDADIERVKAGLMTVFGIENFSFAYETKQDIEKIAKDVLPKLKTLKFETFVVRVQRGNKSLPFTSLEAEREIGAHLLRDGIGAKVKMKGADLTVHVELFDNKAYFHLEKIDGLKGMPSGTAGKVVSLLSSGFDSPVASFNIMRRGAKCVFVHFHSYPHTSKASQDNVREIVKVLEKYQGKSKLYMVPFADIQKEIMVKAPAALRIILYRRYMIRIAEMIAKREKADALVTGESLAQVASQTLKNMRAIGEVATLPVLRPLCGMDKKEIINISREIGLCEICSRPYDDCCSMFTPKNPATAAKVWEVEEAEEKLKLSLTSLKFDGESVSLITNSLN